MSYSKQPFGGRGGRQHSKPHRPQQPRPGDVSILISGHDLSWSFRDFSTALNQIHHVKWSFNDFEPGKDPVTITVPSNRATAFINAIRRSGGPIMAQMANDNSLQHQPIHGDPYNHQTSGQHQNISQQIRQYLTQHYDASKKYLSLESMQKHLPSFSWGKSSCTKALFTECAQYADCKILSLRDNNLKLQNWMAPLFSTLQGLTHLDLSMNNIDDISALSCLSAISHQLEFILFEGNPFTTSYWPSDPTFNKLLYHNDVSRRFPALVTLDSEPINPTLQLSLPRKTPQSFPSGQPLSIPANLSDFASQLISNYFSAYDDNRHALAQFYTPTTIFTLSLPKDLANDPNSAWLLSYINAIENMQNIPRNILIPSSTSPPIVGSDAICTLIANFPQSKHSEPGFCVSVVPISQSLLSVQVTGQFLDIPGRKVRDFSRDFIISDHPSSPLGYSIVNDMLFLSSHFVEQEVIEKQQQAVADVQVTLSHLDPDQALMVQQVQSMTNASTTQAFHALVTSMGNIQQAVQHLQSQQR